jgi:Flp pilus assembly secretin CpaC
MIQLKVAPEVSTLDFGNAVVLQGFRVPALATRRTETSVELRDGQTFAIAGMLDNNMNETLRGCRASAISRSSGTCSAARRTRRIPPSSS